MRVNFRKFILESKEVTKFFWRPCFSQKLLNEQDQHEAQGGILFLCHREKGHDNKLFFFFQSVSVINSVSSC